MAGYGSTSRAAASSPIPSSRPLSQPQAAAEPSMRQMRLKVLYTFDENKTNCLARWPYPLEVRTAFLNSETQVGVIELKTCLQAIATASPEIVAGLGQDYTVYAYDYSEYETPLVGQGMLSWILASASPTPGAPAQHSRTMVTGRVSQNSLGLFSGGSQETLEVKLRLVPVPTSKQDEYLESMKKYRDASQMMPPNFDPQVWTTFLQQNPGFLTQLSQSRSQSPATAQQNNFGIEQVQRLLNTGGDTNRQRQPLSRANSTANLEVGQQLPRLPSPASSVASAATAPKRRGRKPGTNNKGRPRKKTKEAASESTDPGYCTGEDRTEEGPSKKRAKVMQADWDGRELGKQPDSLRVAASTAASVRIHQPTAVRPGLNPDLSLEGQPRAPTPIGERSHRLRKPRVATKSGLGRSDSILPIEPNDENTPAVASEAAASEKGAGETPEKATGETPEKSQVGSSPVDIASSPPDFFAGSTTRSSPRLPDLSHAFEDSNFLAVSLDDLFQDDENRSLDDEDFAIAAQYQKRTESAIGEGDLNTDDLFFDFGQSPDPQLPLLNEVQTQPENPDEEASLSLPRGLLPELPASDPGRPPGLNRSQTWSGHQSPHPASDAGCNPIVINEPRRPASRGRTRRASDMGSHSGVRRKAINQSKLQNSIVTGEIPPYCDHCGAIETPTWRKAWVKIHSGSPEHVRLSDDAGGIIAWQTLQTDNQGTVCLYRIIKKTLADGDEGFKQMLLCNPCGLYLLTRKSMRPKDMWDKSQRDADDKGGRDSQGGQPQSRSRSGSGNIQQGNSRSLSMPTSPTTSNKPNDGLEAEPKLPTRRKCSTSAAQTVSTFLGGTLDEAAATAALQKAIQSSPHKFEGSEQAPIEISDLTPRSTRRVLFPSPSHSGNSKSKPGVDDNATASGEKLATPKSMDKENRPPTGEDDIERFFNEDSYAEGDLTSSASKMRYPWLNQTPKKSPQKRTVSESPSKIKGHLLAPTTPTRTFNKPTGTPNDFTPFTAHLSQLLSEATGCSPGGTGFDLPTLPSLRNTPNSSRIMDFDFSQLDSQDLISTDIPMPSSPPPWNFGSIDDAMNEEHRLWGDAMLPDMLSSPGQQEKAKSSNESGLEGNTATVETA